MTKDLIQLLRKTVSYTFNGSIAIAIAIFSVVMYGLYVGQPEAINVLFYNSLDVVLLFTILCVLLLPLMYFMGMMLGVASRFVSDYALVLFRQRVPAILSQQFTPRLLILLINKEALRGTR